MNANEREFDLLTSSVRQLDFPVCGLLGEGHNH
jgi:hypothetical protein